MPVVRLAKPTKRPIQLRYFCPIERREVRISTGTFDEAKAERQRSDLERRIANGETHLTGTRIVLDCTQKNMGTAARLATPSTDATVDVTPCEST